MFAKWLLKLLFIFFYSTSYKEVVAFLRKTERGLTKLTLKRNKVHTHCQEIPKLTKLCNHFHRYYWLVVILKTGCIGKYGKNRLLNPGTSSQSDGNSSKWLIWLVCGESLSRRERERERERESTHRALYTGSMLLPAEAADQVPSSQLQRQQKNYKITFALKLSMKCNFEGGYYG
jgi:hypothetical protein